MSPIQSLNTPQYLMLEQEDTGLGDGGRFGDGTARCMDPGFLHRFVMKVTGTAAIQLEACDNPNSIYPYTAPVNAVQLLKVSGGTPDGGTWTIQLGDDEEALSGDIDFDATSGDVETAIEALLDVEAGSVAVDGDDLVDGFEVTFQGNLAGTPVEALTVITTDLDTGEFEDDSSVTLEGVTQVGVEEIWVPLSTAFNLTNATAVYEVTQPHELIRPSKTGSGATTVYHQKIEA